MAIDNAKLFNVRIKNKYDSYENWASSGLVLEAGEIAIAHTTVDVKVDNGTAKHPALLMKVGDGEKTFANLPWLSAKAADVLSVCKNENDLTTFVNNVIADAGIASSEAMAALAGRVSAVEEDLNGKEGSVGLKAKVATAEQAIDALELLVGSTSVQAQITAAITALKLDETYDVKGAAKAVQDELEAYETANNVKVDANTDAIAEIRDEENGILAQAKAHANSLDTAMDARVDALESKFQEGEGSVSEQISSAIATEVANRNTAIADAVKVEKERAEGVEANLELRLAAVEGDYLVKADKTALQEQITANANAITLLTDGADPDKVDSVKDLIDYVDTHGAEVTGMKSDIAANTKAINDEVTRATGIEAGHETRITALENANKEGGAVADAIAEAKKAGTDAQAAVEAEVTNRNTAIATAKQEAIDAAATDATTKANSAESNAKAHAQSLIDGLNISQYATQESLNATNIEVAKKANDADLAAIAKTGSTDDLIQGDLVLVFDCGTSAV